jgi:hypothetical protein
MERAVLMAARFFLGMMCALSFGGLAHSGWGFGRPAPYSRRRCAFGPVR